MTNSPVFIALCALASIVACFLFGAAMGRWIYTSMVDRYAKETAQ